MSPILMHRRLVAAVLACLILAVGVLFVVRRTSPQQRLADLPGTKRIVPGPALRAALAALLKEDEYGIGDLDIENYDIAVMLSPRDPQVAFYFDLKQELGGQGILGESFSTWRSMSPDLYEFLVTKDSESGNQPPPPDLVASAEAATALALRKLDAEGVSVTGREKTVKSTDTFWIVEYRFPEGKKPPANDKSAKIVVITAAVYKKTGKVLVF